MSKLSLSDKLYALLGIVFSLFTGCNPYATGGMALHANTLRGTIVRAQTDWALHAKVTFRHAGKGGRGRMHLRQQGDALDLDLDLPMARERLHIHLVPGESLCVNGLEQGRVCDEDADRLLLDMFGEPLPLEPLSFWVRGTMQPLIGGGPAYPTKAGLWKSIAQSGWTMTYQRWYKATETRPALPRRMELNKGETRLRFVIDHWSWGAGE